MPFCTNCGAELKPNDRFCGNCGATVGAPAAPPPPQQTSYAQPPPPPPSYQQPTYQQPAYQPPPTYGEQIHGSMANCATGFPVTIYTLFLTDRRMIAAKTGRFNAMFTGSMAASGGIVGGLIGAGLDATVNKGRKKKAEEMSQLSPDQVLAMDKKNFQIDYASVQSVEMKTPGLLGVGEIKVKTPGKEHKFQLQVRKDVFVPYIALLQSVLPGRVFSK
ncbi:zinc ribbon domain-containing protein [Candidatus Bathyarchaeota archaeon]|nr:zinc ribbon domain-containing protein [Candidatus Bathyarchaeota archaeon]